MTCSLAQTDSTTLTPAKLNRWFSRRWGQSAGATWNARLTALQALAGYCQRQEWIEKDPTLTLERRRVPRNENRAILFDELNALWSRPDIALREKALWRMLYATAARATEVLNLDVEDLDLGRKRAGIVGKGGHQETIIWDAGTARLLPRYLAGRRRGPLFLTESLPNVIPADGDRSPDGRGRLSYPRAWHLFHVASDGRWTLHQLRHSALTHLGENGVSAPLLMAKSRHLDLRTLPRYVRPRKAPRLENARILFHCYSDPASADSRAASLRRCRYSRMYAAREVDAIGEATPGSCYAQS